MPAATATRVARPDDRSTSYKRTAAMSVNTVLRTKAAQVNGSPVTHIVARASIGKPGGKALTQASLADCTWSAGG